MKSNQPWPLFPLLLLLVLAAAPSVTAAAAEDGTIRLFNGRDLSGWDIWVEDASAKPEETWAVVNGILRTTGKPNGYLKTRQAYRNYRLVVEWRWPENPGNSGILMHINGPDKVWPYCVEAQLYSGSAGDFWFMSGAKGRTEPGRVNPERDNNSRKIVAAENPAGEWNRYEIIALEGSIVLEVNGRLVNWALEAEPAEGLIGFQSEGAPIEFRKIELTPIAVGR
jgi:hypothetical protein